MAESIDIDRLSRQIADRLGRDNSWMQTFVAYAQHDEARRQKQLKEYQEQLEEIRSSFTQKMRDELRKTIGDLADQIPDEGILNISAADHRLKEYKKQLDDTQKQISDLQSQHVSNDDERIKKLREQELILDSQIQTQREILDAYGVQEDKTGNIGDLYADLAVSTTQINDNLAVWNRQQERINKSIAKTAQTYNTILDSTKKLGRWAVNFTSYWRKQDNAVSKLAGTFALTRDNVVSLRKHLLEASKDTERLYGVDAAELSKIQQGYAEATGRQMILSDAETRETAAMTRVMGGGENVAQYAADMSRLGISTSGAFSRVERIMNNAARQGVTASKATQQLAKNLKLAETYNFRDGVDGLSRMVVYSEKMRVNMESVAAFADKVSSPEGAIEAAARLQVLGGQFARLANPMAMLYESLNDPESMAERISEMTRGMGYYDTKRGEARLNGYEQRMLKEAGAAMGISGEEMVGMARANIQRKAIAEQTSRAVTDKDFQDVIQTIAKFNEKNGKFQVTDLSGRTFNVSELTNEMAANFSLPKTQEQNLFDIAQNTVSLEESVKNIENYTKAILASRVVENPAQYIKDTLRDRMAGDIDTKPWIARQMDSWYGALAMTAIPAISTFVSARMLAKPLGRAAGWGRRKFRRRRSAATPNTSTGPQGGGGGGGGANPSPVPTPPPRGPQSGPQSGPQGRSHKPRNSRTVLDNRRNRGRGHGNSSFRSAGFRNAGGRFGNIVNLALMASDYLPSIFPSISENTSTPVAGFPSDATLSPDDETARVLSETRDSVNAIKDIMGEFYQNSVLDGYQGIPATGIPFNPEYPGGQTSLGRGLDNLGTAASAVRWGLPWLAESKTFRKAAYGTVKKTLGQKAALQTGKQLFKISTKSAMGPAGWLGLGVDVARGAGRAAGVIEEGSVTDKALGVGSWAATGAGLGSMIAPGIGTAIGAAAGALYGLYDENKEKVNEFLNKTWGKVEEAGEGIWNEATAPFKATTKAKVDNEGEKRLLGLIYRDTDYIATALGQKKLYPEVRVDAFDANFKEVRSSTRHSDMFDSQLGGQNTPGKIKLDISGTLRLDAGRAGSVNLDSLLKDPMFVNELTKLVGTQINKFNNGGRPNNNWNIPGTKRDING